MAFVAWDSTIDIIYQLKPARGKELYVLDSDTSSPLKY